MTYRDAPRRSPSLYGVHPMMPSTDRRPNQFTAIRETAPAGVLIPWLIGLVFATGSSGSGSDRPGARGARECRFLCAESVAEVEAECLLRGGCPAGRFCSLARAGLGRQPGGTVGTAEQIVQSAAGPVLLVGPEVG